LIFEFRSRPGEIRAQLPMTLSNAAAARVRLTHVISALKEKRARVSAIVAKL